MCRSLRGTGGNDGEVGVEGGEGGGVDKWEEGKKSGEWEVWWRS